MAQACLVVMAAGIGSRYGGLKQIDPVGPSGEIILDYSVFDALRAGFDKVVFIIRKDIEDVFRERVGRSVESRVETAYVCQELDKLPSGFTLPEGRTKPWGTGHAVLCAADAVSEPCAVINADDFYGAEAFAAMGDHLRSARDDGGVYDYSMVGFILSNTLSEHGHVARGVCRVSPAGELTDIVERTKIQRFDDGVKYAENDEWTPIDAGSIVSMNMWGFTPSIFAELRDRFPRFLRENSHNPKAEFFVPSVVNELIGEGLARVRVLPTGERWFGITYREDKPELERMISRRVAEGRYPEKLWL